MGKLIDMRERLLDAADLVVDFATLGEYGIEPEPLATARGVRSGSPRALRITCTTGPASRSASPHRKSRPRAAP